MQLLTFVAENPASPVMLFIHVFLVHTHTNRDHCVCLLVGIHIHTIPPCEKISGRILAHKASISVKINEYKIDKA